MIPLVLLAVLASNPQDAPRPLHAGVSVERVLVDARVLRGGRAVADLGPDDFRVRIDGRPAEVVSAVWLSASEPLADLPVADPGPRPQGSGADRVGATRGRTVVFFVQKDLHPSRVPGLLQMIDRAAGFASRLGPRDRAAVVGFDTHLKLWQDFTSDPSVLREALIHGALLGGEPERGVSSGASSLTARLDPRAARAAATPETALLRLGEALRAVAGSKTIVYIGYGMGELRGGQLVYDADYGPARDALLEAGVTVFTLDVTNADYHTLEAGLRQVAEDTGGFYARTHLFAGRAMWRLEQALEGHYVIEVVPATGRRGRHELGVDLVGRHGEVFARSAYYD